jgi:hypothetical protein
VKFAGENSYFPLPFVGIDDLGRVVIPKEIGKTLRVREGPSPITWNPPDVFCIAMVHFEGKLGLAYKKR